MRQIGSSDVTSYCFRRNEMGDQNQFFFGDRPAGIIVPRSRCFRHEAVGCVEVCSQIGHLRIQIGPPGRKVQAMRAADLDVRAMRSVSSAH